MLIGQDYFWFFVRDIEHIENGLVVLKTIFGNILSGGVSNSDRVNNFFVDESLVSKSTNQVVKGTSANEFTLPCPQTFIKKGVTLTDNDLTSPTQEASRVKIISLDDSRGSQNFTSRKKDKKKSQTDDEALMDLESRMIRYFGNEAIGVEPYVTKAMKLKDEQAMENFLNTLEFKKGRYEVGLTFDPNRPFLKGNFKRALANFYSLEKRLDARPDIKVQYVDTMRKYQEENDIEICSKTIPQDGNYFYLPHKEVIREDRTTSKCRVVFNASARNEDGISLNDCLLVGPQDQQDLVRILIRFRWNKVAVSADVKRMYLVIGIREEDRNFLRFVWRENANEELQHWRCKKVTFGVADSSFTSQETFKVHARKYEEEHPAVVRSLIQDRWVDDVLTSLENESLANEYIETVLNIMKEGGFLLKKWVSSSKEVMEKIPSSERLDAEKPFTFEAKDEESMKALGVKISLANDEISFSIDEDVPTILTKRDIASKIATLFDPMGLVSPFSVKGKLIMHRIWMAEKAQREQDKANGLSSNKINSLRKESWNKTVDPKIEQKFRKWVAELSELKNFQLPRSIVELNKEEVSREIHMFADASLYAYAAVVYIRTLYKDDTVSSRLLVAKTRVVGVDCQTMPRAELMAALLGSKLVNKVMESMDIKDFTKVTCWGDSSCTLTWVKGRPEDYKQWVANRIKQIQALVDKARWRYCPGLENPADLATRGIPIKQFVRSDVWKQGPKWLTQEKSNWPDELINFPQMDLTFLEELPRKHLTEAIANRVQTRSMKKKFDYDPWLKLANATNDFRKFIRWIMLFKRRKWNPKNFELTRLETIRHFQEIGFPGDYSRLKRSESLPKDSKLLQLAPFMDDQGIIRVPGRLEVKPPPILLHPKSQLTHLIVWKLHQRYYHAGPMWTVYHLRKQYWVPQATRTVKSIIRLCATCKPFKGKLCNQQMATLPDFRTETPARPFLWTGVDFAGPFYAKPNFVMEDKKYWIVLFTCMQVRAVHLEIVQDMSTETFLMALRRFIARRGRPAFIMSDNGRTFKKAAKDVIKLKEFVQLNGIQDFLRHERIHWYFNVESAPWWGATWERMVRTVKEALRGSLLKHNLTEDEFRTFVVEAESVVNSRPIAEVSDDVENPLPVSPSQLLFGYDTACDIMSNVEDMPTTKPLNLSWKKRLHLSTNFQRKFMKDYVQNLLPRKKWLEKNDKPLVVGEVVLVQEPSKRKLWPLARIKALMKGRDGLVRAAVLQTPLGETRRPIQRLVPLEATHSQEQKLL